MTKFLPFIYDDRKYYTNQKCFILTGQRLEFLTAFFNSNLFKFCFRENFPELLGGTRELSKVFFEKIPVKQIIEDQELPFKEIVIQILAHKKEGKDIFHLEKQIDQMIYKLYELTEEEIKIVEEAVK